MLTEERTRTDQAKVKKALVTAGIILLVILLSMLLEGLLVFLLGRIRNDRA